MVDGVWDVGLSRALIVSCASPARALAALFLYAGEVPGPARLEMMLALIDVEPDPQHVDMDRAAGHRRRADPLVDDRRGRVAADAQLEHCVGVGQRGFVGTRASTWNETRLLRLL